MIISSSLLMVVSINFLCNANFFPSFSVDDEEGEEEDNPGAAKVRSFLLFSTENEMNFVVEVIVYMNLQQYSSIEAMYYWNSGPTLVILALMQSTCTVPVTRREERRRER